ncbi:MAG: leucyl aminopeptidase [Oligoflexia bacterium]|nr:leucyl aminopeptidase [Oligoflexia bacterium]
MLKITTSKKELSASSAELLIVGATPKSLTGRSGRKKSGSFDLAAIDRSYSGGIISQLKAMKFEGKAGESALLSIVGSKGPRTVLVLGWAEKTGNDFDRLSGYRKLGNAVIEAAERVRASRLAISSSVIDLDDEDNAAAFFEGLLLGGYKFNRYKSEVKEGFKGVEQLEFLGARRAPEKTLREVAIMCEATIMARDLVNMPPIDCTPSYLVRRAKEIARKGKLSIQVLDRARLKSIGANALLAVNAGSSEPPFLIKMVYKPRGRSSKVVSLVGKGITFDSGGLSIKTAGGMETMKCDMAGAAAVLAAMQALAVLKPKIEVRAYIPTTENMINGRAVKPGDIVRAMNGKSIEILNTDAEGRLILADALSLAVKEKSPVIIDLATLTGACMVALGNDYSGLFSDDEKLCQRLTRCAELSGERLWRLPLAPEYRDLIKSPTADIKNTGGSYGGAITAALFLKEFVGQAKWAHLDIAGPAFADGAKGYIKRGGTGFGVRTLIRYVMERF